MFTINQIMNHFCFCKIKWKLKFNCIEFALIKLITSTLDVAAVFFIFNLKFMTPLVYKSCSLSKGRMGFFCTLIYSPKQRKVKEFFDTFNKTNTYIPSRSDNLDSSDPCWLPVFFGYIGEIKSHICLKKGERI